MTENENLEKQIADDLSAVLKEAKSMGCKEVACFRHIPLQNVETVIKALEEIQQYRAIGTVEEFEALKEKSEPMQWIQEDMGEGETIWKCPDCNEYWALTEGTPKDNQYNFCPKCGRALKLSE